MVFGHIKNHSQILAEFGGHNHSTFIINIMFILSEKHNAPDPFLCRKPLSTIFLHLCIIIPYILLFSKILSFFIRLFFHSFLIFILIFQYFIIFLSKVEAIFCSFVKNSYPHRTNFLYFFNFFCIKQKICSVFCAQKKRLRKEPLFSLFPLFQFITYYQVLVSLGS